MYAVYYSKETESESRPSLPVSGPRWLQASKQWGSHGPPGPPTSNAYVCVKLKPPMSFVFAIKLLNSNLEAIPTLLNNFLTI